MGLFTKKVKIIKEIKGMVWGHLGNVHKVDVDTWPMSSVVWSARE